MNDLLILITAFIWVDYKALIITWFVISKILTAVFLKLTGYNRWWLGLVPYGWAMYKRDIAGIPIPLIVAYVLAETFFIMSYQPVSLVLTIALKIYTDYQFCSVYFTDANSYVYGAVPLAKYYFMYKEVKDACRK